MARRKLLGFPSLEYSTSSYSTWTGSVENIVGMRRLSHLLFSKTNELSTIDEIASTMIGRALQSSVEFNIPGLWDVSSAYDVWTLIKEYFAPICYTAEMKRLSDLSQGDLSVTEFGNRVKIISANLEKFRPSCACDRTCCCAQFDVFYQKLVLRSFLRGLSLDFEVNIMSMQPMPSLDQAISAVVQLENETSDESNNSGNSGDSDSTKSIDSPAAIDTVPPPQGNLEQQEENVPPPQGNFEQQENVPPPQGNYFEQQENVGNLEQQENVPPPQGNYFEQQENVGNLEQQENVPPPQGNGQENHSMPAVPQGTDAGQNIRRRLKPCYRDSVYKISKGDIRRLARRGGVKRIQGNIYPDIRALLKIFVEDIVARSFSYADHAHRKTVTTRDVAHALKSKGMQFYGFDG
ncbi:uncharacterized protein LOC123890972 [Trifolium pratense]|uniref:uncharacterized protein LOC123890972 n=1 Tax=Trifolium pratense TaxID=57577 RepID=UPI001E69114E|nr:uncharacterized protein LOC123890972 [Trifolium pratense]